MPAKTLCPRGLMAPLTRPERSILIPAWWASLLVLPSAIIALWVGPRHGPRDEEWPGLVAFGTTYSAVVILVGVGLGKLA